jgi:hypothetical protein
VSHTVEYNYEGKLRASLSARRRARRSRVPAPRLQRSALCQSLARPVSLRFRAKRKLEEQGRSSPSVRRFAPTVRGSRVVSSAALVVLHSPLLVPPDLPACVSSERGENDDGRDPDELSEDQRAPAPNGARQPKSISADGSDHDSPRCGPGDQGHAGDKDQRARWPASGSGPPQPHWRRASCDAEARSGGQFAHLGRSRR